MHDFWNTVSTFEKFFWYLAVPTTVISLVQIILTSLGMTHEFGDVGDVGHVGDVGDVGDAGHADVGHGDGDAGHGDSADGHDAGHHVDFKFFTLRNLIILAATFGWSGIVGNRWGFTRPVTVIFAMILAFIVTLIVAGIFYVFMNLRSSGTMNINNALDAVGTVYLPIPAEKAGAGMVQIPVQGSLRDLNAMTDGPNLSTGEKVKVVAVIDRETLLVKKLGVSE